MSSFHEALKTVSAPPLSIFRDRHRLYKAAAESFTALAHEAIGKRNRFTVALAGGSTPRGLYELLAEEPYREQIAWGDCDVFWGDERAVPADHAWAEQLPWPRTSRFQPGPARRDQNWVVFGQAVSKTSLFIDQT